MNVVMDADSFIFSTAVKMQYDNPFLEGVISSNWTMVRESFIKKLEFFKERYKVDDMIMYVSGKDNFRKSIYPEYKANRGNMTLPVHLGTLKAYAVEFLGAIESHGAEADDYCVSFKLANPDWTMSAIDKDVINFVQGKHLNYWKEDYVETSETLSIQWPYIQTLMGDTSDNIIGLKGIGPKTAQKLLCECTNTNDLWKMVKTEYERLGRTKEEALINMQCVRMDQFDHVTKTLKLWQPPKLSI